MKCPSRPATTTRPASRPVSSRPRTAYINIASAGDEIFGRFCRSVDRPDLAEHPDYKTGKSRSDNRKALNAAIEAVTQERTSADWIERLNKAGVPSGPIYKMDEVFADPQVKHLGIAQTVHHPKLGDLDLIGQAVTLSRTPSRLMTASPDAGEHTDAILASSATAAATSGSSRRRGSCSADRQSHRRFSRDMAAWRHDIHAHSRNRVRGDAHAARVAELLESFGIAVERGVAKTGVIGTLKGNTPGPRAIALRADMDALHVHEKTGASYASQNEGGCMPAAMTGTRRCCSAPRVTSPRRGTSPARSISSSSREENEGGARA